MFHEEDELGWIWYREWEEVTRMQFPSRNLGLISKTVEGGRIDAPSLLVHASPFHTPFLRNGSSLFPCLEGGNRRGGGREDLLLLQAAGSSLHRYALGTDRSDRYGVCHSQQSIDQPLEPSPQPSSFQFHSQSRILEICLLHYGKLLTMVVFGLWKWDHGFPDLCCRSASVNGSWQVEFEIFISIFGKFLEYLESFLPSDGSFGGRCLGSFVDVDQIYGGWN